MSEATVRAVRAGLLISPDEGMKGRATLDGYVLRFNPLRPGVDAEIDSLVGALTASSPRCVAVLQAVLDAARRRL